MFHVFWLQEDRLLVLWSSISHFLSTGSYPIWASSFISHLFIWHLNNSSIQEYKSELWYAVSYPVKSSAHMAKSFRKAGRKRNTLDVSVTLTLSSKAQLCKKHHSQWQILSDSFPFHFIHFPSRWMLWLEFESLSIYQRNLLFFPNKVSESHWDVLHMQLQPLYYSQPLCSCRVRNGLWAQ